MRKDIFEGGKKLPLIDEFYTIQGEGFHFGKAAYFIRIGGCDIGCKWCDTKYSWNASKDKLVDVSEIVANVNKYKAQTVVITGGEPLIYNLDPICNKLNDNHIQTFIETSGAHKLSGNWDWICLSPKKNNPPKKEIYAKANELKVIIYNDDDIKWAEECAKQVNSNCLLFLQPEWSRKHIYTPRTVEYIKKNPQWQLSLQAHKYINIP